MNCLNCNNELIGDAKFCGKCGQSTEANSTIKNRVIIKCGSCEYVGDAELNRTLWAKILAWLCVLFLPIVTILYFAITKKYRCPKCKSTFVGIKDKDGNFVDQKTGVLKIVVIILASIMIIGVLSSVILAAINSAREKTSQVQQLADWITYNAISDQFTISIPHSPRFESTSDTTADGNSFEYHSYSIEKGLTSFMVIKYIYTEPIDVSNPDNLLEKLLNGFISGSESKLTSSSYTNYKSFRGLDFTSKTTTELIKGRILLVGGAPYLLIASYPASSYANDGDYDRFVSSFDVK